MSRRTASRVISGLLVTGFAPLFAQQSRLDRDVEFVRKLATDLGFTALAQQEVDRLQTAHRDSEDFKQVFQLGIEVALVGARTQSNREEARTLFKDALERSKEFIDRYSNEPVADRARRTLIEACYEYGAYLLDEIDIARVEAPERISELEQQAAAVYKDGITAAEQVMASLEAKKDEAGSEAQRDFYVTWLFKGMLQREMARAVQKDREALAPIARDTFEEFIFEVGEESLLGLRGWFEMSKIGEVLGNYDDAYEAYNDTIASIHGALDEAAQLGLSLETQEYLFGLMQEAYDGAASALFQQGKTEETLQLIERFRADLQKYGQEGAEPFEIAHPMKGHPVFLSEARALSESGDAEKIARALELAQKINDAHPNDITGVRAKKVLEEILEIQNSGVVSGSLLFEVAKGKYQEREWEAAIQGVKRAYGAMTPAERQELGVEAWSMVARSFGIQDRLLEAALAAAHGLEQHGKAGGTAEESLAKVMRDAWEAYQRNAKTTDVPALKPIKDRVLDLLARFGGKDSEGSALWREAQRLLSADENAKAAASYAQVPMGTPYYDPAQARVVVAWQQAGDHEKARAAMKRYLDWLETPEAKIPSNDPAAADTRQQALATIAFYDAYMDYLEAVGRVGGAPDPTRFEPTIQKLRKFIETHGKDGPTYVPNAWDIIARLQTQLGQLDKAEESYRTLRKLAPNSALIPALATAIFSAHFESQKALQTEYQALIDKKASDAELKPVAARLAEARRKAIASGIDYLENSAQPSFSVLYSTLIVAADHEDWKTTERVGRKIIELFAGTAEHKEDVEKHVMARLGQALLEQRKFQDAVEILTKAVEASPANYEAKRFLSLAQGGWFEFDDQARLIEVTGMGQPAEAYRRHWNEYKSFLTANSVPKYSLAWYEFECECFMFAALAARKDSSFEQLKETHFGRAQSIDDFATLRDLGPKGRQLYDIFMTVK